MAIAKVLIIDDEHMIRWSLRQTLAPVGYEVAEASTLSEGVKLFHQLQPEVVFLDMRLPDGNGLDLIRQMREGEGRRSAVVIMTAFTEDCTADDAARLGASAYLQKPFRFDELEALLFQVLPPTVSAAC